MNTVKLLEDYFASATSLNMICIENFGLEYLNWEPETVKSELYKITKSIPLINFDKIQAIATLLTTEQYYLYMEPFINISLVLNNESPEFERLLPLDGFQICWSLIEAKLNDPEETPFSKEIENFIKMSFKFNGLQKTPEIIKKYILPNYDEGSEEEYESELLEFITFRLDKIKKELTEE